MLLPLHLEQVLVVELSSIEKVYHGSWNTAGELGHTIVQPNGRECGCGNHGCLEAYAGARHIVERTQQTDP